AEVASVDFELHPRDADIVSGAGGEGDPVEDGRPCGRSGHGDGGRGDVRRPAGQQLGWHLDEEGVQTAASSIARPDEVLACYVQVALGVFRVGLTTPWRVEIGHDC